MKAFKWKNSYSDFWLALAFSGTVNNLIIINIFMFILIHVFRGFDWVSLFGLIPRFVSTKFMFWQLGTYLFVHVELWHLVFNMLMLWFFGTALEKEWGSGKFLVYYFITGIGAGLCSFIFSYRCVYPVIGASGIVFGLLTAYALIFPESIILLFFIFPMKIKYAVVILAGINLLSALANPGSAVAYIAQLGAGALGYLYLKNEWLRLQAEHISWHNLKQAWIRNKIITRQDGLENLDQQVDMILDKIAKQGIKSLTRKEKKILDYKSKIS